MLAFLRVHATYIRQKVHYTNFVTALSKPAETAMCLPQASAGSTTSQNLSMFIIVSLDKLVMKLLCVQAKM